MSYLFKAALMVALLALGACNNPDRFGAGGQGGPDGIDSSGLGNPSDPQSVAYFQQTLGDRVFFAVNESTLSPEARATLAQQAQWLQTNAGYAIIVEGHADEQGTREYNLALGARRASAAESFLASQGVASNRMRTVSYGKERPIAVCSTEECYSQNRRAVTVLSLGAGS